MLQLPKIYPITNVELSGLSHADQVQILANEGCRFVQIREKSGSSREIFDAVVESVAIANAFGMKIILNDRVDIAIGANAHGVHLGQDDLPPSEARKLLGEKAIIGYSTHSADQAIQATRMPIATSGKSPIASRTFLNPSRPTTGSGSSLVVVAKIGPIAT